ncbi:hypothetical protein [Rhodovulum marinum]|uniref:Dolichyl-phosphate-mannose-protein mannosyltransferase n=1 Tax=Rhodovulum marinum TaxID=320662 RepID=A0A4R2PWE1_9RHOB|nr:hypothetical protein [Rhodovulum marinum]TCP39584.1 hypothetical protein EV662_11164 [Rhodovulum marinum]
MDRLEKRIALSCLLGTALLAGLVLLNALFGVFYDTDHFGDTLFLLGAGWRVAQGLTPVIDFGHFYGGVMAEGIAATMALFGPGAFAFDYFTLLLLGALSATAGVILFRRMSLAGMAAVILTLATLMLTRYPLELNDPIIGVVSTHSFLYNRVGLALLLLAGLYSALRAASPRGDLLPGVLVGLLVVLAMLTKPTFAVLAPAVLLALALQRRWHGLGAVLIGMVAALAVLDPTLQRWLGALAYAQAQVGDKDSAQVGLLMRKAVQIPLAQPVATTFALAALATLFVTRTQRAAALGLVVVSGAGVGMAATMGGNGSLGQLALPMAILIALAAAEIAHRANLAPAFTLRAIAFCLVAAFALPHGANLARAAIEGYAQRDRMLISEGPYASYLALSKGVGRNSTPAAQYEMLADGIAALHRLGDPSQWGIVADNGVIFEHAILGRPVPGYPLWQRPEAPELAPDLPIAPEADIAMIGRSGTMGEVGRILTAKLRPDFIPCTTSTHWTIHVRRTSAIACPTR